MKGTKTTVHVRGPGYDAATGFDVAYFWKRKRVCMTLLSAALARTRIKYE